MGAALVGMLAWRLRCRTPLRWSLAACSSTRHALLDAAAARSVACCCSCCCRRCCSTPRFDSTPRSYAASPDRSCCWPCPARSLTAIVVGAGAGAACCICRGQWRCCSAASSRRPIRSPSSRCFAACTPQPPDRHRRGREPDQRWHRDHPVHGAARPGRPRATRTWSAALGLFVRQVIGGVAIGVVMGVASRG